MAKSSLQPLSEHEPVYRHNFPLFLLDNILFSLGMGIASPTTVIPDFIRLEGMTDGFQETLQRFSVQCHHVVVVIVCLPVLSVISGGGSFNDLNQVPDAAIPPDAFLPLFS